MAVCVRSFLPEYSPMMATLNATLWLLSGAACGVVIYIAIDALLWLLVGKPAGAERALLDQVIPRLARLVPRRQTNG
jgi:hypothetical protein